LANVLIASVVQAT